MCNKGINLPNVFGLLCLLLFGGSNAVFFRDGLQALACPQLVDLGECPAEASKTIKIVALWERLNSFSRCLGGGADILQRIYSVFEIMMALRSPG